MTSIPISIKYGQTIYHLNLDNSSNQSKTDEFDSIARHLRIASDGLKLIYKGKRYTRDNWHQLNIIANMTFLSIGEQNEDETNINDKDIECIMKQIQVDRNTAVRALKLHANMTRIESREDLSLFDDAFAIYQQIPEFQDELNSREKLFQRFDQIQRPLILLAYIDDNPVGFLIGYERYSAYYIWLAGVLPQFRRQGVFLDLLIQIEQWAKDKKYSSLTIKTRNCFKSMLSFLIKNDFKLIDIEKKDSVNNHRLILSKSFLS